MGLELRAGQLDAVKKLKAWWSGSRQVFEIAGYAGTGKSTIINTAINELHLDRATEVRFVTFTGKASLVLNRKGVPATTIHKLIYQPEEVLIPKLDSRGKPCLDSNGEPIMKKKTVFNKVPFISPLIKLIVADECSMISESTWEDLLSFGVRIVVLGDEGQLPPIKGESPLLKNPDVRLTEIMRQQEGDPIVYLSMLAREGKYIPMQKYGPKAWVVNKNTITDRIMKASDIILCGKNKTRQELNDYYRYSILDRESPMPVKNDKLICRRNNWETALDDVSLINGLIGFCHNPIERQNINPEQGIFKMDFRPEFIKDDYFEGLECDLTRFLKEGKTKAEDENDNRYHPGEKFEFAYAITTHLSQGSSWSRVLVFEETFGDRDFQKKWLYTAITRAEDCIIIAK